MLYTYFLPFFETIANFISNYFYFLQNLLMKYKWSFLS